MQGDLRTYRIKDEVTRGYVVRATIAGSTGAQGSLLPELQDAHLIAVAPLAMLLRGFERVETKRGRIDYVQEWWVREIAHHDR